MVLHFHQPVGNFEDVVERAYKNCYSPLIDLLCDHPDIKINLHISGCLLDYLEARKGYFLDKLSRMCGRGQIEFLSGGYYEPIFIAIPPRDLQGQIAMLSEYLKRRFKCRPRGAWITERVWQPRLSAQLSAAGIDYCILDDTHLLRAGVPPEKMRGYYLTGRAGKQTAVFPSDKKLRYGIPFGSPAGIIDYFSALPRSQSPPLLVYGDDGEKFGEWPGTHKWVYEEGWLKNFFKQLEGSKDWLKLVHLSRYLDAYPAQGKVEIPEASYDEMLEWTGGSWLNFLSKYPEANQMHKKMCYVSAKLNDAAARSKQEKKLEDARRKLYQGQCNCAYWHGVFGGLYLYHLRSAIYGSLIAAENILDGLLRKKSRNWQTQKVCDYDLDGKKEVIIEDSVFSVYISPAQGAVVKELDYRPANINVINTLSRREEPYHKKIMEKIGEKKDAADAARTIHEDNKDVAAGISRKLIYDRYPRYCFREHFIDSDISWKAVMDNSFHEYGGFSDGEYKIGKDKKGVFFSRRGLVGHCAVEMRKRIVIKSKNSIRAAYTIRKGKGGPWDKLFGVEFNLTMPWLDAERYAYFCGEDKLGSLRGKGVAKDSNAFTIFDDREELGIRLDFSDDAREIYYFPVQTVSQSERAYEMNFQSCCILPVWEIDRRKKENYSLTIDMVFPGKNIPKNA